MEHAIPIPWAFGTITMKLNLESTPFLKWNLFYMPAHGMALLQYVAWWWVSGDNRAHHKDFDLNMKRNETPPVYD